MRSQVLMRVPRIRISSAALLLTVLTAACESHSESISGTEIPGPRFDRPTCPGHPSCDSGSDGDGGFGTEVTVDLAGDVIATDQAALIETESHSRLVVQARDGFGDQLSLVSAAGSLAGCVTDPDDLDPVSAQRLMDRLDDPLQERLLAIRIDRKKLGEPSRHHGINHTWSDDGDGHQYRTRITDSSLRPGDLVSVAEGPTDVFTFTGGSVVSWDTTTDEALACPNGGSVTLTLDR